MTQDVAFPHWCINVVKLLHCLTNVYSFLDYNPKYSSGNEYASTGYSAHLCHTWVYPKKYGKQISASIRLGQSRSPHAKSCEIVTTKNEDKSGS